MLCFVATPIGNLEDFTYRALNIMKSVDYIVCENSRKTGILLKKYGIKKSMKIYNDYNKKKQVYWILKKLKEENNIAFVSSAGTPLISDPGFYLVKNLIREGLPFTSIPGPSAVINSLVLSGLPPDRFIFEGYLSKKQKKRREILKTFAEEERTVILFESPRRIERLLNELISVLPEREVVLIKEMTKIHQSVIRGKPHEIIENLPVLKGEFIVLIGGKKWTGID